MDRSRLKIELIGDGKVGCSVLVVSFGKTIKEQEEKLTLLDIMEGTGFRKIDDKVWVVPTTAKMERGGFIEDQVALSYLDRYVDKPKYTATRLYDDFESLYPSIVTGHYHSMYDNIMMLQSFSAGPLIETESVSTKSKRSDFTDVVHEKQSQRKQQNDNRVKNNQKFYTPPKFQQREGSHCVGRQNWRHENKRSQHKNTNKFNKK